ncbi:MAG: hypothetical protein L3K18_07325 [Thermoplasmata archaeon]|nr:hypothetical protein [Thermoplasmata archaeon]
MPTTVESTSPSPTSPVATVDPVPGQPIPSASPGAAVPTHEPGRIPHADESSGLRRIATGSTVGLAAGVVGLALPVTLLLLARYRPGALPISASQLLQVTAVLALTGALLFAVSLIVYRLGFASLRAVDPRFWAASALCMLGTVGLVLIVLPIAIALASSDTMAACIQGAPTKAPACLRAVAPLASYLAIAGVWLVWLGGLGIVLGIGLASVRYREAWLSAGAALYALIILGLLAPGLSLMFPIGGIAYAIVALPLLVLLAPALTSRGSHRAMSAAA